MDSLLSCKFVSTMSTTVYVCVCVFVTPQGKKAKAALETINTSARVNKRDSRDEKSLATRVIAPFDQTVKGRERK